MEEPGCGPVGTVKSVDFESLPNVDETIYLAKIKVVNERRAPELANKTYQQASLVLRNCQLPAEFLPRAILNGEIFSSIPAADSLIDKETELVIWMADGSEVPIVVGQDINSARKTLQEAGFEVGDITRERVDPTEWQRLKRSNCFTVVSVDGNVKRTEPAGGAHVVFAPNGSERAKIKLIVESYAKLEAVPDACNDEGIPF